VKQIKSNLALMGGIGLLTFWNSLNFKAVLKTHS